MVIKILKAGDEAALEAFLMSRIDSSMFLLSNMRLAGLADNGEPYQGTYAAAYENGEIVAVAAHFWNQMVIIQAPAHLETLLPALLEASGRGVKGMLGLKVQVEAAKVTLGISKDAYKMDESEKLYSLPLDRLVEPPLLLSASVHVHRAKMDELELLTRWRVSYSIETLGDTDSPELWQRSQASVERAIAAAEMWVLAENGRLRATTAFNSATKEAVQVGGVWTPPAFRRRGYARAVVAASLRDARAEGVPKAILFTGSGNVAAQKAYEALGFRHIGEYCIALLKTAVTLPQK